MKRNLKEALAITVLISAGILILWLIEAITQQMLGGLLGGRSVKMEGT